MTMETHQEHLLTQVVADPDTGKVKPNYLRIRLGFNWSTFELQTPAPDLARHPDKPWLRLASVQGREVLRVMVGDAWHNVTRV